MTCLLRTRGSASEIARLFGAEPDPRLEWREAIWTGEAVPVVVIEEGVRRLRTMTWGLPAEAFAKPAPSRQRGTIYSRDFTTSGTCLHNPASLDRCLIVLESFAYPIGNAGQCTRSWMGLQNHPLTAWAGVCTGDHCAGVLVRANERVEPLSDTMPCLLQSEDWDRWLDGGTLLSLGPCHPDAHFYCENLGERWSTGLSEDDMPPLFSAAA